MVTLRPFLAALAAAFLAIPLAAQPAVPVLPPVEADSAAHLAASPRHGEWVTLAGTGSDRFDAWVVYPERPDKAPVVVVIHEIFGLTDWARAVADQYAAEGFLVIAPDFLSGKAPDGRGGSAALGPEASRGAIAKLDPAEILSRLDASARYASALPAASGAYGVVGYCWGGGTAFSWATAQPGLGATVVFYGTSPAKEALARVKAPVLGLYGGNDARVNATVPPAQEELKRLGKRFEAEFYEGAGHAFLRQQAGQNGANLKASQAAWPRSVAFLREALGTPKPLAAAGAGAGQAGEPEVCLEDCLPPDLAPAPVSLVHAGH